MDISPLNQIANLPTPAKVGLAAAGGAGLLGIIYMLTSDPKVLVIVAVGMVLVGLLLVAYRAMLKWMRKRKAAPLERGILDNTASSPTNISEPARRARLDDLRKSFESGIEKFKASGKNIYSLPWYLLVGEPGSGKTEAIRHCNVGFPPGLQDQLQGAGGTLNMNWWFTNHAIVLDTAGRLMFEEVEPGQTSEWKEFLKLLTRVRPNCPVNGMLLVIPSDSLIRDTADSIERKAGKIAQQLDAIQRALGVRFPVFIVITKCDLINGFREFFDGLTDPQLQHQILGWSNPAPLDEPFNPEEVDRHLRTVAAALSRRRGGLLVDPVHTDDPNARRIDQVDALYAFPDSLLKIAPRLRRYLEMIFVAGEWSPKPLFLRGIYFTSSMREGTALDQELAEALKVPVESLPEGRVWERDRAYFLRDLFMNKVFRERGLVTRAANTGSLQRRRKVAVLSAGFLSVLLLLGLTWFGATRLKKSIGGHRAFWSYAANEYEKDTGRWPLVSRPSATQPAYRYDGGQELLLSEGKTDRASFLARPEITDPIVIPWVFRPLAGITGSLEKQRDEAVAALLNRSVLKVSLEAARDRVRRDNQWSDHATAALAQLIRLETYAAKAAPASSAGDSQASRILLTPVIRYIVGSETEYQLYSLKHAKTLQEAIDRVYGKDTPIPEGLAGTDDSLKAVDAGIQHFSQYWNSQVAGQSPRRLALARLADALEAFRKAEDEIRAEVTRPNIDTNAQFEQVAGVWKTRYATLAQLQQQLDQACAELEANGGWPDGKTTVVLFEEEVQSIAARAEKAYRMLLDGLPAAPAGGKLSVAAENLNSRRKVLESALRDMPAPKMLAETDPVLNKLRGLDADRLYLARSPGLDRRPIRRYAIHLQIHEQANGVLSAPVPEVSARVFTQLAAMLKDVDVRQEAATKQIESLKFESNPERLAMAQASCGAMVSLAARAQRSKAIELALKNSPRDAQGIAQLVAADAKPASFGRVPLCEMFRGGEYERGYWPDGAEALLAGWRNIEMLLVDPVPPSAGAVAAGPRVLDPRAIRDSEGYRSARDACSRYCEDYLAYWNDTLAKRMQANLGSWADLFAREEGRQWQVFTAMGVLTDIAAVRFKALGQVRDLVPESQRDAYRKAAELSRPLTDGERRALQDRVEIVIEKWRGLGDKPRVARETILNLKPDVFVRGYIIDSSFEPGGFIQNYWSGVTHAALGALATESKKAAVEAMKELAARQRFPLAAPRDGVPSLTPEELVKVRELVADAGGSLGGGAAAAGGQTIREGATYGQDRIDARLADLRGAPTGPERAMLETLRKFLSFLPDDPAQPVLCKVYVLDLKTAQAHSQAAGVPLAGMQWTRMRLVVGGGMPGREQQTLADPGELLGELRLPGKPVVFEAQKTPEQPFEFSWPDVSKGPWADAWSVLRLVHQPGVQQPDGWTCHVPIPVNDGGGKSNLWIRLEFDKQRGPIPPAKDWPAPQGK